MSQTNEESKDQAQKMPGFTFNFDDDDYADEDDDVEIGTGTNKQHAG
jgi:hypothetical protein